jgi:hypothetical protein
VQYALEQPQPLRQATHSSSHSRCRRRTPRVKKSRPIPLRKSVTEIMVEALGREVTRIIVDALGGTRIWVPTRSGAAARLAQVIGGNAAAGLCAHFAGDYLQVPNKMPDMTLRHRIAELHRQGCKINNIALAVGRSRRTVFRLLQTKITDLQRPGGFDCQPAAR